MRDDFSPLISIPSLFAADLQLERKHEEKQTFLKTKFLLLQLMKTSNPPICKQGVQAISVLNYLRNLTGIVIYNCLKMLSKFR